MTKKKQDYESTARIVSFRLSPEAADKLIGQGYLNEKFDRKEVSSVVKDLFEKMLEGIEIKLDRTTQKEVKGSVEQLMSIVAEQSEQIKLLNDLLQGKFPPQAV